MMLKERGSELGKENCQEKRERERWGTDERMLA
jgi:hypothetical protein